MYRHILAVLVPRAAIFINLGNSASKLPVVPDGRQSELALCCTTVILWDVGHCLEFIQFWFLQTIGHPHIACNSIELCTSYTAVYALC